MSCQHLRINRAGGCIECGEHMIAVTIVPRYITSAPNFSPPKHVQVDEGRTYECRRCATSGEFDIEGAFVAPCGRHHRGV